MDYYKTINIAVFSVELFTPTAKFIKRDSAGLGKVTFFANKKSIPSQDFFGIEIVSPNFSLWERVLSFISRWLGIKYYFMSSRMKLFFIKEFKERKIDLIIAHFGPSGIDILDVCNQLNLPLVTVFHGYDISKLISNKSYLRGLERLNSYNKSKARAVSNFFVPELCKYINADKIFTLPNGVEVGTIEILPTTTEELHITQAANLVEKKGIEFSIKAVTKLIELYPNKKIFFNICGNGPLRIQLERLVRKNDKDKILFHGHLAGEDFKAIMDKTNIFIHPSVTDSKGETETIPTAILEAMSEGKIVLSTIHAGIPEVVINNYNGFLVKEKCHKALTTILSDIILNKIDVEYIRTNAINTIKSEFNAVLQYEKLKKITLEFYEECKVVERN
jgi:colanic acid/amylovoran biosynthesis glycosyltransferase